jgi:gas vesicle structural protein
MTVDRVPPSYSAVEIIDRVLDKGVVIDAWLRVSAAGIEVVTAHVRVIVASIATYLQHSSAFFAGEPTAQLPRSPRRWSRVSLDEQLYLICEQLEAGRFRPQPFRRAEDRARDSLHDARARTLTHS